MRHFIHTDLDAFHPSVEQIDYSSFLGIILTDEISRRENRRVEIRLRAAGFEESCCLEDSDWVRLHHHGPPTAGCRVPPGVHPQARASPFDGTGRGGQELPGSGLGLRRRQGRDTPSASFTPTTSLGPCLRPGCTTPWTGPSALSFPQICSY